MLAVQHLAGFADKEHRHAGDIVAVADDAVHAAVFTQFDDQGQIGQGFAGGVVHRLYRGEHGGVRPGKRGDPMAWTGRGQAQVGKARDASACGLAARRRSRDTASGVCKQHGVYRVDLAGQALQFGLQRRRIVQEGGKLARAIAGLAMQRSNINVDNLGDLFRSRLIGGQRVFDYLRLLYLVAGVHGVGKADGDAQHGQGDQDRMQSNLMLAPAYEARPRAHRNSMQYHMRGDVSTALRVTTINGPALRRNTKRE